MTRTPGRPGPVPGGKARGRLAQFENARGIAPSGGDPLPAGQQEAEARVVRAAGAAGAERPSRRQFAEALAAARAGRAPSPPGAPRVEAAAPVPAWTSLGPSVIHRGQTYGASSVDVCGRVSAIAVDPHHRSHLLLGAAGGGVWESHDTGATWTPRADGLPTLATGALCFDPHTPDTVYLGSGEGDFYAALGHGVFRSTDGGTTWEQAAADPFVGYGFFGITAHPVTKGLLFAATGLGLSRSTDGGDTWDVVRLGACWGVSVDPHGGEVLAGCDDGLSRSTDGGLSWKHVKLAGAPKDSTLTRMAVSHPPRGSSAAGAAWVAAAYTSYGAKAPDADRLWRRPGTGKAFAAVRVGAGVDPTQAWYDWHLHASPERDTLAYLGAINLHRVDVASGKAVWHDLSTRQTGDSIHPDQHCLAFDPVDPKIIYAGCDGGLFRSPDRGTTWTSLNTGLGITEVEYLAQHPTDTGWVLAGTQDNGTIRRTAADTGHPRGWRNVQFGDGGDCGLDVTKPERVYHSYYDMGLERSDDGGDTWTTLHVNIPRNYGTLFYPPMEVNRSTVAQAGSSVYVSRDAGESFTNVTLPGAPIVTAMTMPTPNEILLGTEVGSAFRIAWSGTAWKKPVALTPPCAGWISDLDVAAGGAIWATSSELGGPGVFRSGDHGASWVDRSVGLPAVPVNAVVSDPADGARVWVGADTGVYESRDDGATWTPIVAGLPNCLVEDLLLHAPGRLLRAGTRSRGVWEYPVP